jgi:septum formation protein
MDEQTLPRMILASASPRRKELLARAGYSFEVVPSGIDESAISSTAASPCGHAETLALAKARHVAMRYPDRVVIGADTLVDCDGQIIGKADTPAQAEAVTRRLFSAPHKVVTGLAVIRLGDGSEIVRSEVTVVFPRRLTERQIAEHIAGGSWRGKSGAYAIREKDDPFVERIEGSLSNVMGLPLELLRRLLQDLGESPPDAAKA